MMAKGDGKNKYGHPLPYKGGSKPMKNVCSECSYHDSHSPSCSRHPDNQRKRR